MIFAWGASVLGLLIQIKSLAIEIMCIRETIFIYQLSRLWTNGNSLKWSSLRTLWLFLCLSILLLVAFYEDYISVNGIILWWHYSPIWSCPAAALLSHAGPWGHIAEIEYAFALLNICIAVVGYWLSFLLFRLKHAQFIRPRLIGRPSRVGYLAVSNVLFRFHYLRHQVAAPSLPLLINDHAYAWRSSNPGSVCLMLWIPCLWTFFSRCLLLLDWIIEICSLINAQIWEILIGC